MTSGDRERDLPLVLMVTTDKGEMRSSGTISPGALCGVEDLAADATSGTGRRRRFRVRSIVAALAISGWLAA